MLFHRFEAYNDYGMQPSCLDIIQEFGYEQSSAHTHTCTLAVTLILKKNQLLEFCTVVFFFNKSGSTIFSKFIL